MSRPHFHQWVNIHAGNMGLWRNDVKTKDITVIAQRCTFPNCNKFRTQTINGRHADAINNERDTNHPHH